MTIGELLDFSRAHFLFEEDHKLLLAHALNVNKEYIFAHPEIEVSHEIHGLFLDLVKKRADGVPFAYLVGSREFFGRTFFVSSDVLIPRPETEVLIEHILAFLMKNPECRVAYDIGTGSGCLAITLALEVTTLRVVASDISKDALSVAKKNINTHGVGERAEVIHQNLMLDIDLPNSSYIVVANLPYISPDDEMIEVGVRDHEPSLALFAENDGIDLISQLLNQSASLSRPPVALFLEIGSRQAEQVSRLVGEVFPKATVQITKDLAGLDRVVSIYC